MKDFVIPSNAKLLLRINALFIGIQTANFVQDQGQLDLMDGGRTERWRQALEAADRLRDRYGESAVALGSGMRGRYRERVQENPAALPGKEPRRK